VHNLCDIVEPPTLFKRTRALALPFDDETAC
jgi:hypothetical protein